MPETTCNAEEGPLAMLYTTFPEAGPALAAARVLIDERLVACANLLPGMRSLYRWQGRVEIADEVVLLLKTTSARMPEAMARIAQLHPYDVPCVVEVPLGAVHGPYGDWLRECVRGPGAEDDRPHGSSASRDARTPSPPPSDAG